jgi:predicted TIM-barrel fold metal-dependent hydrolase
MDQATTASCGDLSRSRDEVVPGQVVDRSIVDGWYGAGAAPIAAIDAHAHVFVRDLPRARVVRHTPSYDATLDAYVGNLVACGISHAVLVQPSFLGTDNSFALDVLRRYPMRFRGVAVVDPDTTDREFEQLVRTGVVGIRLNLIGMDVPDFNSSTWRNHLARANAFDLHIEVHRQASDLPNILGPLLAQSCRVVVDHFGRPAPALGVDDPGIRYLLATADSGRVWVKLSAAYRNAVKGDGAKAAKRTAAALFRMFTAERLLWGSDWPHTQHRDRVDFASTWAALETWIETPIDRSLILRDSAASLFRFKTIT